MNDLWKRQLATFAKRAAVMLVLMAGAALSACSGTADLPRNSQTVDGITIYLGVVSAQMMQADIADRGDPKSMHGGTSPDAGSHHIVVALFDAKTGKRIVDARVKAGVGDRSYDHEPDKPLEPMLVNGLMSYGNFFLMQGSGTWRIHLEIQRPGKTGSIQAEFAYDHAPGD